MLPEKDPLLQALVKSGAPVKTIFGKSWDLHVTDVIRTTLEENLDMIESSVDYLKDHSEEVIYDAEHFFDGYKANSEYALETLKAAERGRADFIVLCDTNGGTMPWELEKIVKDVKKVVSTPIGIHVHNDAGLGVCNSLFAVKSGATMVQGVVNGYGERCGNANLTTIAADLHFKMGAKFFAAKKIARLRQLSSNVDQIVNLPSDVHAPYVGDAAFAHKGGAHIDGVMKVSRSFEHIDPHEVGNDRVFVTSDQAGGSLVVEKLKAIKPGIDKKDPVVGKLLTLIKERENAGWHFDSAEASFKLLVYRHLGMVQEPFKVLGYRVIEDKTPQGVSVSQATVKLQIGDKISIEKAHPDIYNILLQILDDGILTDSYGRKINFKNTIIIMTSNAGAREVRHSSGMGFTKMGETDDYDRMEAAIRDEVKRVFSPEFLNRIDEQIVFRPLSKKDLVSVVDIQMGFLQKNISDRGILLEISQEAKEFIVNHNYDSALGARPIRRSIQNLVEDAIAEGLSA